MRGDSLAANTVARGEMRTPERAQMAECVSRCDRHTERRNTLDRYATESLGRFSLKGASDVRKLSA